MYTARGVAACLCALAGTSMAMAIGPEVIISTAPTGDTAIIPGLMPADDTLPAERLVTDFGNMYRSGSGNHWIVSGVASRGNIGVMILGTGNTAEVVYRAEGLVAPWAPPGTLLLSVEPASIGAQYGVNDEGDFTFGIAETGGVRVVVKNDDGVWSVVAREGEDVPFSPGQMWGDPLHAIGISPTGSDVFFRADNIVGSPVTEDEALIIGGVPVLRKGVTIPTGQNLALEPMGLERVLDLVQDSSNLQVDATGTNWAAVSALLGTANDDILLKNYAVIAQQGGAFSTSTSVANSRLEVPQLTPNGQYVYFRGQTTGGLHWVARNNEIIATGGDPITEGSTENWTTVSVTGFSRTFFNTVGDNNGNYVILGGTNAATNNSVAVYNEQHVLLRNGDPLDLDGNGLYDDNARVELSDNNSELFTHLLTEDGWYYITVGLRDTSTDPATDIGEAIIRIQVPQPPACLADFDNMNGVQVADIFAFLRAWFANAPSADFDGMNGIQVADIFAFLRAWFAGCP